MFFTRLSLLSFLSAIVTLSNAQHNITVNNTSPSIQYEGNAKDAPICKINPDGTIPAGQPGCYNVPSQCTAGATMGQGSTGAASFSFNGSAVYIESLLNFLSPIYTVTLDGESTDVDGVRPSGAFICAPLFSRTGLDPNVEHKVRMSVKGPSPNRNTSIPNSDSSFVFSLISYTFTEGGDGSTTPTSGGESKLTTKDSANSATSSVPSGAQALYLPGWEALVAITTVFGSLLV